MVKREWEAEELHRSNKTIREESDYTDEALAFLNRHKLLINLWKALISALDTEFKPSKKPLPRVLNLNLLRARQLQRRRCYIYPAIVRLGSGTDQRPNFSVPHDKIYN